MSKMFFQKRNCIEAGQVVQNRYVKFHFFPCRPPVDDPANSLMHAQTIVTVKGPRIGQEVAAVKRHCPTCESRVVVSRGKLKKAKLDLVKKCHFGRMEKLPKWHF